MTASDELASLATQPLPADTVGLLEGLTTTRAIRRYTDEPVPDHVLRDIMFAATRAPSSVNRQHWRFIVLRDEPLAQEAKALIAEGPRAYWAGVVAESPEGSPQAEAARGRVGFAERFPRIPVVVIACLIREGEAVEINGASIYLAVQNLLLAARGLGYGGVFTLWQGFADVQLRALLGIPDDVFIAGIIPIGRPAGRHGPVRRAPIGNAVYESAWGRPAAWAIDPPGALHPES